MQADGDSRRGAASTSLAAASWVLLLATLLAAFGLRLVGLAHLPGINGDECTYGVHAMGWLRGESPTGSGLFINPVGPRWGRSSAAFLGVVVALHALFGPSPLTLRLSAFALSVACVLLSFVLFRRRGFRFTLPFAVLLAALPIHLGYARLAWDPTAVPAVTLLALASALALRPVWTTLAFGLSLWVHPITVFSLPILATPFLVAKLPRDAAGRPRRPSVRVLALVGLGCLVAVAALLILERRDALPTPVLLALRGDLREAVLARLASPGVALRFTLLYTEFLAGPTLYRYVAGSLPDAAALVHVVVFVALAGPLVAFGVRRLSRDARWLDLAVVAGLLVSLVSAYLFGGLKMLTPHTERYGMFLTVPSCYVLATCIEALSRSPRAASWLRIGTAAAGVLALASFTTYLLGGLHHPDPGRARTFRTGDEDPKSRALAAILELRRPEQTTVVYAEDWWIYWPMRYLAEGERDLRLTIPGVPWEAGFPRDFALPPVDPVRMELFGVAWSGSRTDAAFARAGNEVASIRGYEPGPILHVYRLPVSAP